MPRPIEALIHVPALAHNLARARHFAPDAKVWAVVKANAYGHGLERVFEGLRGADGFALLDLDEAQHGRDSYTTHLESGRPDENAILPRILDRDDGQPVGALGRCLECGLCTECSYLGCRCNRSLSLRLRYLRESGHCHRRCPTTCT